MHTIYALLQPVTRQIRYVGCTFHIVHRMRMHALGTQKLDRSSPLNKWLFDLDGVLEHIILQEVEDKVAHEAEVYWINLLGQVPSVDLLNVVDVKPNKRSENKPSRSLRSRLKREDFKEIRNAPGSLGIIAERYDVSHTTISRIKRGLITESLFDEVENATDVDEKQPKVRQRKNYPPANAKPDFLLGHKGRRIQNFLTPAQFEEIRKSIGTKSGIARRYGISTHTVTRIKNGLLKEDLE